MHSLETESYGKLLDTFYVLPKNVKEELFKHIKVVPIKKGDYILKLGEIEKYSSMLFEGIARAYQIKNEKEVSIEFIFKNELVTGYSSFITQRPSQTAIVALNDCIILKIHKNHIYSTLDNYHSFERLIRIIAEYYYVRTLDRELELLSYSAEERYLNLFKKNEKLVQEIPIKHLASYLGIKRQSLSRIRAKIIR